MNSILIFVGNPHTLKVCNELIKKGGYDDVEVHAIHNSETDRDIMDLLMMRNPDVIISRGSRAESISEYFSEKVVEIPTTPFDFLHALEQASQHGKHVGIIGYKDSLFGLEKLSPLFKIKISTYAIQLRTELEGALNTAIKDGVDSIISGKSLLNQAKKIHIPCYYVETDEESVKQAINEARRTAKAISKEKEQKKFIQSFLEHFSGALIAVDKQNAIIISNPEAHKLFQLSEKQFPRYKLEDLCHDLSLERVLKSGISENDVIVNIDYTRYVCEKVPVIVDDDIIGALALIKKVSSVQQTEANIRRKIYETGFIAENCFDDIAGNSSIMINTVETAKQFAITDYSILLLGESGTGKEVFAQSIHNESKRYNGPFVAINCAAVPDELLESELFGYEAGAFTGAKAKGKTGMIELAHGGTLFLDEIGEMSLPTQGKLLRVLQERKIMRLGGDRVLPVDVRVITATNRNLLEGIREGKFRQDLYYRLNVLKLQLPPLRNRIEDLPQLIRALLKKSRITNALTFSPGAIQALKDYQWPGNIRELNNILDRIIAIYGHSDIINEKVITEILDDEGPIKIEKIKESHVEYENDISEILRVLKITEGNYTKAAHILGISRITLWRKLKKHNLK